MNVIMNNTVYIQHTTDGDQIDIWGIWRTSQHLESSYSNRYWKCLQSLLFGKPIALKGCSLSAAVFRGGTCQSKIHINANPRFPRYHTVLGCPPSIACPAAVTSSGKQYTSSCDTLCVLSQHERFQWDYPAWTFSASCARADLLWD